MSVIRRVMFTGFCVGASVAMADAAKWVQLDQRYADTRAPSVVLQVKADALAVAPLRLRVDDSPLEIDDVRVYLDGGQSFDVALKAWVGPGRETRSIQIPGGPKAVQKVEVAYRLDSDSGKLALVRLLGTS